VQVRAQHRVDAIEREAGGSEVGEERAAEPGPRGQVAHLVVADAGVDDDRLAARLDHEGVDRGDQATLDGREVRPEPRLRLHRLGAQVGEQEGRRHAGEEGRRRAARFDDPRDGDVTDSPAKRRAHARTFVLLTPTLPCGDDVSW